MALETADKRKFETFLPAATVLRPSASFGWAPYFGQDDREGAGQWPKRFLLAGAPRNDNRKIVKMSDLKICEAIPAEHHTSGVPFGFAQGRLSTSLGLCLTAEDAGELNCPRLDCHAEASQWPGYSLWVVITEVANRLVLATFALEICEIHNPASVRQNMQE
jgi:hypothetical protein